MADTALKEAWAAMTETVEGLALDLKKAQNARDALRAELQRMREDRAKAGAQVDELRRELEAPWACPRCDRSDLMVKHAVRHARGCASEIAEVTDLKTEMMDLELERDAALARAREAEEALREVVKKWMPHSGLCVASIDFGKVVLHDPCACGELEQRVRALLASRADAESGSTHG